MGEVTIQQDTKVTESKVPDLKNKSSPILTGNKTLENDLVTTIRSLTVLTAGSRRLRNRRIVDHQSGVILRRVAHVVLSKASVNAAIAGLNVGQIHQVSERTLQSVLERNAVASLPCDVRRRYAVCIAFQCR